MPGKPNNDRPTRWIFISDPQLGHSSGLVRDNDERARRLIERVAEEKPDFVINGGDHINGALVHGSWVVYNEGWNRPRLGALADAESEAPPVQAYEVSIPGEELG